MAGKVKLTEAQELIKRIDGISHYVCDPECEGRCKDCPLDVLRDIKEFLASSGKKE